MLENTYPTQLYHKHFHGVDFFTTQWYIGRKMFGFIDESGAPGVASHRKDCLAISLVVFRSEKSRDKSVAMIESLRAKLKLPDDYEFHCSSNSLRPQTEFLNLLSNLDFRFISIVIHKNDFKKTASYSRIAKIAVDEIEKRFPEIKIEMDKNATLLKEFQKNLKTRKLSYVKIHGYNSRSNRLIQVADYVVNISAKRAKNTSKSSDWYSKIAKKAIAFIEITD